VPANRLQQRGLENWLNEIVGLTSTEVDASEASGLLCHGSGTDDGDHILAITFIQQWFKTGSTIEAKEWIPPPVRSRSWLLLPNLIVESNPSSAQNRWRAPTETRSLYIGGFNQPLGLELETHFFSMSCSSELALPPLISRMHVG
jgi:hypothetical protein